VFFAGEVVVRLGTGSDAVNFPRTAAILEAARDTVAVPRVLFVEPDRASFRFPVVVLSYVPGEPMSQVWAEISDDERIGLLAQVADQLSRLRKRRRE
jgi:tRNA A-37 threonylcarbamoyl transferase component Bud32